MQIGPLKMCKSNILKNMGFVVVSVVLIAATLMPGYASELTLEYASGNLSANVSKVSLENLVKALSSACDIKVFLDESIKSKEISTSFSSLPLEKAIERLVKPYSTALVFGKKRTLKAQTQFYVKEVKIYDSSNKNASYMRVGENGIPGKERTIKQTITTRMNQRTHRGGEAMVPNFMKDPGRAAAYKKEISSKMLQTRMAIKRSELKELQRKMRDEEKNRRNKIMQLQQELKIAPEDDAKQIQAEIAQLSSDLKNINQRNEAELKRLETELEQMKHTFVDQKS